MARKLITYDKAKSEIKRLQKFVDLVEDFDIKTTEDWIIYQYAHTNTITKIMKMVEEENKTHNGELLDREYVTNTIRGNPTSELHKLLRSGYMIRTRHSRRRGL